MIKNTTKHKLNEIYKTDEQNLKNVNRLNHLKQFTFHPESFFKYVYTIELEREYIFPLSFPQTFSKEYSFTNLPDWIISSAKLIPKLYSDTAYQITTYTGYNAYINWKQMADENYILQVDLRAEAYIPITLVPLDLQQIPVYLDLDVIFYNNRELYEIFHPKIQI